MAQEWKFVRQTRRFTYTLEAGLAGQGGSRAIAGGSSAGIRNRVALQWRAPCQGVCPGGRSEMLRADLLKPDLFSEIVLLGSGALLFVSLLLIVVTALARA
jgi:hypothetical protein